MNIIQRGLGVNEVTQVRLTTQLCVRIMLQKSVVCLFALNAQMLSGIISEIVRCKGR